jgi:hypothetical protein
MYNVQKKIDMKALWKGIAHSFLIISMLVFLGSCRFGVKYYCPAYGETKKIAPKGHKAQNEYTKKHKKDQRR